MRNCISFLTSNKNVKSITAFPHTSHFARFRICWSRKQLLRHCTGLPNCLLSRWLLARRQSHRSLGRHGPCCQQSSRKFVTIIPYGWLNHLCTQWRHTDAKNDSSSTLTAFHISNILQLLLSKGFKHALITKRKLKTNLCFTEVFHPYTVNRGT